jgi:hypothetical protein
MAKKPTPAAKKAAGPPKEKVEFFYDVVQGGDEWLELRRGILTASNFKIVLREGVDGEASKMREKLLYTLAGERLSGKVAETFRSEAMSRGHQMEPAARDYYERTTFGAKVRQVGFVRRTMITPLGREIVIGASPDAQVDDARGLEIKTLAPHLMIAQAKSGKFPSEHYAQLMGTAFVCGWSEMDLLLFYEGMPVAPRFRVALDNAFVTKIVQAIEVFDYELSVLVRDIKAMSKS